MVSQTSFNPGPTLSKPASPSSKPSLAQAIAPQPVSTIKTSCLRSSFVT